MKQMALRRAHQIINRETLIPISLVISICVLAFFVGQIYTKVYAHSRALEQAKTTFETHEVQIMNDLNGLRDDLRDVSNTTAKIDGKIDVILLKLEK